MRRVQFYGAEGASQLKSIAKVYKWLKIERCVLCDQRELCRCGVCVHCYQSLSGFDEAKAGAGIKTPFYDDIYCNKAFKYPLDLIILQFKYKKTPFLAAFCAYLAYQSLLLGGFRPNEAYVSSFIPTSLSKYAKRGFNQAHLLNKKLVKWVSLPLVDGLLCLKAPKSLAQAKLSKRQRQLMAASVAVNEVVARPLLAQGKDRVLLVDDVFTTGATVNEAARALKAAGFKQVDVVCVARVELHSEAEQKACEQA